MSDSYSQLQTKPRTSEPKMYDVVFHNDDVTTMEFVVFVLRRVFFHSVENATQLMLDVHQKGSAVVGTYSYDIAISKYHKVQHLAEQEGFPLRVSIVPTDGLPF